MSYRPDAIGHNDRLPLIFTSTAVIDVLGQPGVDRNGLAELIYGDLGVPSATRTSIHLISHQPDTAHVRKIGTPIIEVDPIRCRQPDATQDITSALLAESQRLADELKRPKLVAAHGYGPVGAFCVASAATYLGIRYGVLPNFDAAVSHSIGEQHIRNGIVNFLLNFGPPYIGGMAGEDAYKDCVKPFERRAERMAANQAMRTKYADVISFPNAPTTSNNI